MQTRARRSRPRRCRDACELSAPLPCCRNAGEHGMAIVPGGRRAGRQHEHVLAMQRCTSASLAGHGLRTSCSLPCPTLGPTATRSSSGSTRGALACARGAALGQRRRSSSAQSPSGERPALAAAAVRCAALRQGAARAVGEEKRQLAAAPPQRAAWQHRAAAQPQRRFMRRAAPAPDGGGKAKLVLRCVLHLHAPRAPSFRLRNTARGSAAAARPSLRPRDPAEALVALCSQRARALAATACCGTARRRCALSGSLRSQSGTAWQPQRCAAARRRARSRSCGCLVLPLSGI